ncbi:hypothetical protein JYT72_00595 [Crocinitomix catalasitica]|nr:hypothetical protein [Crocinitomix catalasitica]
MKKFLFISVLLVLHIACKKIKATDNRIGDYSCSVYSEYTVMGSIVSDTFYLDTIEVIGGDNSYEILGLSFENADTIDDGEFIWLPGGAASSSYWILFSGDSLYYQSCSCGLGGGFVTDYSCLKL